MNSKHAQGRAHGCLHFLLCADLDQVVLQKLNKTTLPKRMGGFSH
jgi:hypothetical protein